MLWLLYNLLFALGFCLLLPRFLFRMRRRGGYGRDFGQRFARYQPPVRATLAEGGRIWIHAVSVGELFVARSLMRALRERDPASRFVISTTTSTGYAILRREIAPPDVAIYFPLDFPHIVRRAAARIQPTALVLVEGEFWPNLVRTLNRQGVPIFLVNGRISDRSFRGYRRLRPFTRRLFRLFDALCVQSETDRGRLIALGAPAGLIKVLSSAKYDLERPDEAAVTRTRAVVQGILGPGRTILLGGSTWPGEEAVLVEIFQRVRERHPRLALILAPRHVERKAHVIETVQAGGASFRLRSTWSPGDAPAPADVLILDTTGELKHFYAHADLIFVGKSLCAKGGQNIIEPAQCGKPVIVGPHMKNFPVVMEDFREAGAVRQVDSAQALEAEVIRLLEHPEEAAALGARAAELVRAKAGALEQTARLILERLAKGGDA
jgi:3-deoxy-D-manno-octulosonic-acid transferase